MPGTKDTAWNQAKALRDREFNQRDAEIDKWKQLYAEWQALVNVKNIAGAKAKNDELNKQSQVVARIEAVIGGKLEAMTALQHAATLEVADTDIGDLIQKEIDQVFALLRAIFTGLLGGIFNQDAAQLTPHEDAIEKVYMTLHQIKGKQEIKNIVHALQ